MSYTPGPWNYRKGVIGYSIFSVTKELFLAYTRGSNSSDGMVMERRGENEANARLMAAAPMLLEAASNARMALAVAIKASWEGATDEDVAKHTLIKQLDAAIAEAKGER